MAHTHSRTSGMNLIFYLLIQIIVLANDSTASDNDPMDNIGLDISKHKPTDEGNINMFESSLIADFNRDNVRADPENETNKNKLIEDIERSGLSLENSQGELWYDQAEHRMRSREKKDNPGNRIRVPDEYEHSLLPHYSAADQTENNDSIFPNTADVLRFPFHYYSTVNAKPLFTLCKSGKPTALAACLAYMALTEGRNPCSHPINLATLVYCLDKRFSDDLSAKEPTDDVVTKRNFFTWAGKRNNNKVVDIPKRIPFHSWGGKRSNPPDNEIIQPSRVPFNAWGGKRLSNDSDFETYDACKRSKLKFHSWGGKRSERK